MNKKFKYTPLAIMIASALSISGCDNSNNDTVPGAADSSNSVAGNLAEVNTEKARVKLAVKFPQADATAAWVGDSKSIEVSFFNTKTVGSIAEAYDALNKADAPCDGYYYEDAWQYECNYTDSDSLRGQFATSVTMDTGAPSAFVDLLPGKYRIEAKFYNGNGKHQETSVSYVTLSKGEHSLKLRGLEATWTATEQLNLQLLNQSDEFDWDPSSDGMQSAAEAMGITGAIKGLHLPTVLTYPDGYLRAENGNEGQADNQAVRINAGAINSEQLDKASQATAFQPVLRIADAEGGEYNLLPRFLDSYEDTVDEQGEYTGASGSWNKTELATLQQEYNSEGDNASLDLGGYFMGYWNWDNDTMTSTEDYADLILGIGSLDSEAAEPQYTMWYSSDRDGLNEGEQLTIARIHTDNNNEDSNWQQLFVDLQATPNQVVDGRTITGYLIEAKAHSIREEASEWQGTGKDVQPVSFLEAALFDIAETEGLVAQGAAEDSCRTQAITGVEYSNDYLWDEAQQGWIAGTYNAFLSEYGLLADIDSSIAAQIGQRDSAQSELDVKQEELAVYDAEIVAIVEAQMAGISTTISEVDAISTANSELIANYATAVAESDSAYTAAQEKWEIYDAAVNQVTLYNADLLPDCDTACGDALVQQRDTAQAEENSAWELYYTKADLRDALYSNYQVVEQQINDLIAPYNIWSSAVEDASSELQARNVALQTTLDLITSNSDLTYYDDDNWELYNNRQNALWPVNNALATVANANDVLAQLAQLKAEALATADLNGDGEATIFEEGVYLATGDLAGWVNESGSWDETTGQYSNDYYLELNEFTIKETVKATSTSGEQTICVQPFTLKASQLSIEFDTAADVVIE